MPTRFSSHLSEEAHLAWVEESARLLSPRGVLIVTTRPVGMFRQYEAMRLADSTLPDWALPDARAAYDRGDFCFAPTGGGANRESTFYGEAVVPAAYVQRHWRKRFQNLRFLAAEEHGRFDQSVVWRDSAD